MRQRLAPNATRTAVSEVRIAARANSKQATFTQAINSTNPTAPDKNQERRTNIADHFLIQRVYAYVEARVVFRVSLDEPPVYRVYLGLGLLQRHARFEPREDAQ
jgi:hypothetical protein